MRTPALLWDAMARRSIAWVKDDQQGAEFADVMIIRGRLGGVATATPAGLAAPRDLILGQVEREDHASFYV